jgi:hypothetical protein
VGARDEFDRLRKLDDGAAAFLPESDRIIRQFLRGDAKGPITERRSKDNYAEDLLGGHLPTVSAVPPVSPSR